MTFPGIFGVAESKSDVRFRNLTFRIWHQIWIQRPQKPPEVSWLLKIDHFWKKVRHVGSAILFFSKSDVRFGLSDPENPRKFHNFWKLSIFWKKVRHIGSAILFFSKSDIRFGFSDPENSLGKVSDGFEQSFIFWPILNLKYPTVRCPFLIKFIKMTKLRVRRVP